MSRSNRPAERVRLTDDQRRTNGTVRKPLATHVRCCIGWSALNPTRFGLALVLALVLGLAFRLANGAEIVRASEFGNSWPYAADTVELVCNKDNAVFFIVDDQRYYLNGLARALGYRKPSELWKRNVEAERRYLSAVAKWKNEYGDAVARQLKAICPIVIPPAKMWKPEQQH